MADPVLSTEGAFISITDASDGGSDADWFVSSVNVSTGKGADVATMEVRRDSPLVQTGIISDLQTVELGTVVKNRIEKIIFFGQISGVKPNISDSESLTFEVRAADFLFGTPFIGTPEQNQPGDPVFIRQVDAVFNPTLDGVVRGNLRENGQQEFTFLDPVRMITKEQQRYAYGRTGGARDTSKPYDADKFWTLRKAAFFLCKNLNEDEKHYDNPTWDETNVLDDSKEIFRDAVVQIGDYLPAALEKLLEPYGFSFCVDYVARNARKLKFLKRGSGTKRVALLQAPGTDAKPVWVDPDMTNTEAVRLAVGYQSLYNQGYVLGNFKLWESTWELNRAWKSELDSTEEKDLTLSKLAILDANDPKHRVWRDWVLNESGDYNGRRATITDPYPFTEFGEMDGQPVIHRRRRFFPCITLESDRRPVKRHGYDIEYWDTESEEWQSLESLAESQSVEILTDECGIRFSGMLVPQKIYDAGEDAKVRITASVFSDERIEVIEARREKSLQPLKSTFVVDAPDKFHFRKVHENSKYHPEQTSTAYESSAVDDTEKAKALAKKIVDSWDKADVSGTITIPSLVGSEFNLGDVIVGIDGRDIDLWTGATSKEGGSADRPQITGISYDVRTQKRTLHIQTFRDTRFV